jgi:hypothetical protein
LFFGIRETEKQQLRGIIPEKGKSWISSIPSANVREISGIRQTPYGRNEKTRTQILNKNCQNMAL